MDAHKDETTRGDGSGRGNATFRVSVSRDTLGMNPDQVAALVVEVLPGSYLAECVCYRVLESQLPHKIVNLLFTIPN